MRILLRSLAVLCLAAGTMVWAVNKSGTISSAQTWSGSITLTGDVTIIGGPVSIQPGCTVSGGGKDFKIKGAGVVKAIGTAGNRITFTGVHVIIEALTKDLDNFFQYVDMKNNYNLLEFRNPKGVNELSTLKMDNCTFYGGSYCLMYVTSGGSPKLTNCHFEKASSGIFCHGADVIEVSYCTFTDVSTGVISGSYGGAFYEPMLCKINHCVFYDIDNSREVSGVKVASGYAICSVNSPGTMEIKNNIFHKITYSSIRDWNIEDPNFSQNWTVINDYNCHYQLGRAPFYLRSPGSHSLQTNPRMTNPAGGDYSLQSTSPCRNAASDGTHIGAWQESPVTDRFIARENFDNRVQVSANPFARNLTLGLEKKGAFSVTIMSGEGTVVRFLPQDASGSITWDGRDAGGRLVPNGVYFAIVNTNKAKAATRLVKAE